VARALAPRITRWHVASLPGPRGASAAEVVRALAVAGVAQPATPHDAPASAFAAARGEAHADDRIVAFGSFLTVAEVMQALAARRGREPHG
jgi:dihydrofolate synthase/folylpolyglutamate synthase